MRSLPPAFRSFLVVFILGAGTSVLADELDPPMKWGQVPMEQLAMKTYPADSNASALILCDYGDVYFNGEYHVMYTRHRRIKILSKKGFDWGTHVVSYYTKDRTQRFSHLEGTTTTLQADGSVATTKLDDESIFEEEVNNSWDRVRFTLPALTEGCIIEYRYTIESTSPHWVPAWEFQSSEPALWSEFRFKVPNVFGYAVLTRGYERFFINESKQTTEPFRSPQGMALVNVASARWAVKDAPAIRQEPFMTTTEDYITRVAFQLSIVTWPGHTPQKILHSWDNVVEELADMRTFGGQLSGFGSVRKQAEALTAGISDPLQKAVAIYDFVRNTIVWDNTRGVLVNKEVDDVLEAKTGNVAEVNLLLTLMLRHAGLSANPVLLSTRDNGKVYTAYPMVDQFNYVIARLQIGTTTYLLDATDRFRPYTLLPVRALNQEGFSVEKDTYSWIPISPAGKGTTKTAVTATLAPDGTVKGTFQKLFADYSALSERQSLSNTKDAEYMKDLLDVEASGIKIDSFTISNRDSFAQPLVLHASFTASGLTQVLDKFIIMNPIMPEPMKENPFKLAHRTFPVDYAYPREVFYVLNLTLPAGYILKDPPREVSLFVQQGIGRYTRNVGVENNALQLRSKLEITKPLVLPPLYRSLRDFYDRIVSVESEQVLLEKDKSVARKN